ncbi:hypothetical protein Bbelb_082190 [Branchiostoma belcheri]|nr:hypothetical protein Bbelb_082190 [Branchiostoma belcheri]
MADLGPDHSVSVTTSLSRRSLCDLKSAEKAPKSPWEGDASAMKAPTERHERRHLGDERRGRRCNDERRESARRAEDERLESAKRTHNDLNINLDTKHGDLGALVALSQRSAMRAERKAVAEVAVEFPLEHVFRGVRRSFALWPISRRGESASQYCWSDGSVLGAGDVDDWSLGQPDTIYGEKCGEIRPQCSYHCNNHHCGMKGPILNCKFFIKDSCRLWKTEKIEQPPLHTGSQTQYLLPHGPSACPALILGYYKGPLDGITE